MTNNSVSTIVFVDSNIVDYQTLVDGVESDIEVVVLDANCDGIEQINRALTQNKQRFNEIHLVSHGAPGCLYLGQTKLSLSSLSHYETQLQNWQIDDLLIYGCQVAANSTGIEFVKTLQTLTQANIAVSSTKTGNSALDGNWNLEVRLGNIQASLPFQAETIAAYQGVLVSYEFFDINPNVDSIANAGENKSQWTPIDNSNWLLVTDGYAQSRSSSGNGLNNNGIYTENNYRPRFELAYKNGGGAASNYLLNSGNSRSFSVPQKQYSEIHLAATSTEGSTTIRVILRYTDGTNTTSNISVPDWFSEISNSSSRYYLDDNMDRVQEGTFSNPFDNANDPAVFGFRVLADSQKTLQSVEISNQGSSSRRLVVLGSTGVYDDNQPPTITSNDTVNLEENTNEVIIVTADDPDSGDSLSYSISDGNDSSLFAIDSNTGVLSFNTAPDYENPGDSDLDNVYEVEVAVSDGSASQTQNLLIAVNNANESPTITSNDTVNLDENTNEAIIVTAEDPDSGDILSYSISGGNDHSLFSIDAETGLLSFNTAPDYENPGDSDSDNVYEVEVAVSDGDLTKTQNLLIAVDNVNELSIVSNNTVDFYGDTNEIITVAAEDPDAGDIVTYSISGGVDSNLFSIDPDSGVLVFDTIPDYENPSDSDLDNIYEVEVSVSDGDLTKTQNLVITAKDPDSVLTPLTDIDDSENTIAGNVFDNPSVGITANSSNPNNDTITYSLLDDFNGAFAIDADTGVVTLADPLALNYGIGQEYNITVEASNGVTTVSNDFAIAPDTISILSSLISQDNLIQLTNEILSLIPEFTLNYSEIAESLLETIEISVDNFLSGEIELDLANTFGFTDTESTEYKLVGAIVDTIDGTEEGVTDTTLSIQGLTYISQSTPDDPDTPEYDSVTQNLEFAVAINNQDFIYSKDDSGYSVSYGGSVDVLALIRTLANETGIVELPEGVSLNVSGFNLSSTLDEDDNFNDTVGESNQQEFQT